MVGNLVVSRDLVDPYSLMASEFYTAIQGVMECMGRPNVSDVFPSFRWLDLQGLRRKMDYHFGKALKIVSGLVEERMNERQEGGEKQNDFLDVLLDFEGTGKDEPAKLSEQDITIFLLCIIMLFILLYNTLLTFLSPINTWFFLAQPNFGFIQISPTHE